jgi:hypothetical protein
MAHAEIEEGAEPLADLMRGDVEEFGDLVLAVAMGDPEDC